MSNAPAVHDLLGASPSLAARARTQALNLSVKPVDWVSWRSVAACAWYLLRWPGSGTGVYDRWVRDAGGAGESRAGLGIDGRSVVLVTRLHLAYVMHAGGPSEDTLQQVLSLVLERLEPEGAVQLFQVCKPSPSHPLDMGVLLPSLPLTVRPANVVCWTGWLTRESHERWLISLRLGRVASVQLPQCFSLAASYGSNALNLRNTLG